MRHTSMKKRLIAALITFAAVIVFKLWPQADAATEMARPAEPPRVVAASSPIPEIEPIRDGLLMPNAGSLGRNLFGYREPVTRPIATPPVVEVAPPIVAA